MIYDKKFRLGAIIGLVLAIIYIANINIPILSMIASTAARIAQALSTPFITIPVFLGIVFSLFK